jgi:UDP-N-acetylglucosamine--N-acetylmuramyl-(pentapeptide) pyrophosphoryl-undecaprenol N-acetylglucosamine transferase
VTVLLAGGGTAGHVVPALAIADALVAGGMAKRDVMLAGSTTGQEQSLVPLRGYALISQPLVNLRRRPNGISDIASWAWRGFRAVTSLLRATMVMWKRFGGTDHRPDVVVSVGGYASVPAVLAARLRQIPIVVVSYDAHAGLASRVSARLAKVSAVAFSTSTLPRRIVTGAPVRADVLAIDRVADRSVARSALGVPDDVFMVVAVGGSLGAGKINDVMIEVAQRWSGRDDVFIRHIVGQRNADVVQAVGSHHQVVAFEADMDKCYGAADVLVARAGAATVAEIGAVGVASVLVPWSGAAGNHQEANARSLSDGGGAELLTDEACSADAVEAILQRWQHDRSDLDAVAQRARQLGHRNGAATIAALIVDVARGHALVGLSS